MKWTWHRRIARAGELANRFSESAAVLSFYRRLARFQASIFEKLNARPQTDVSALTAYYPKLLKLVRSHGPKELAACAPDDPVKVLGDLWGGEYLHSEHAKFYARVLLQPFAEALAARSSPDHRLNGSSCPFCSAPPVVGILRGQRDEAKRSLLCSLCGTEWYDRRVVCPNCGEEDKDQLPVYLAEELDYVRIDACDTCGTYIKSVDLTKNGEAVPVVDELAAVTLTLWAEEKGYEKIETNLLGM